MKHRTAGTGLIVLIVLAVLGAATFAWYVYQTSTKTNQVHMAAGTSTELQISNAYDGEYSTAIDLTMDSKTLNPISTDKISNGFQKATVFEENANEEGKKIATGFGAASENDYLKVTLYLRSNGGSTGVYACSISYDDNEAAQKMATALRVGYVIYEPGENTNVQQEYIFILSEGTIEGREYNTQNGSEGDVLDSTQTDGSVVTSPALGLDAFATYDSSTGTTTLGESSQLLFTLEGGSPGTPVQVDVYFWLEGCDSDCSESLGAVALENIAVMFAAK